jgi:hypothetical protein
MYTNITAFLDMGSCSLVGRYVCCCGICCFHFESRSSVLNFKLSLWFSVLKLFYCWILCSKFGCNVYNHKFPPQNFYMLCASFVVELLSDVIIYVCNLFNAK